MVFRYFKIKRFMNFRYVDFNFRDIKNWHKVNSNQRIISMKYLLNSFKVNLIDRKILNSNRFYCTV